MMDFLDRYIRLLSDLLINKPWLMLAIFAILATLFLSFAYDNTEEEFRKRILTEDPDGL